MKFIRLLVFALFLAPFGAMAVPNEFGMAAQLLAAAKNADIQQVQLLVNNGANVNFVDSTGLSLVCTALMNNDLRAAQILQMYGADASQCDKQIKNYKSRNTRERTTGGLFGGLSTAQGLFLAAAGAAVVVGGIFLLTDWFDPDNDNNSSSSSGSGHGGGSGGGGSSGGGTAWSAGAIPYGPAMPNAASETANYSTNLAVYAPSDTTSIFYKNFKWMNGSTNPESANYGNMNYLLLMHGYSPLARDYMGLRTLRRDDHTPILLGGASYGADSIEGGRPVNVALVTANGINAATDTSLANKFFVWTSLNSDGSPGPASLSTISSKYYNNLGTFTAVNNYSAAEDTSLITEFDLSNSGTAIHNAGATFDDNLLAKIVGGYTSGYTNADFVGFMPYGQMTIYRTGGGKNMTAGDLSVAGSYDFEGDTIAVDDTMTFTAQGIEATVVSVIDDADGDTTKAIVWSYTIGGTTKYIYGYLTADGLYYVDFDGDGASDFAYTADSGNLLLAKQSADTYYKNYDALVNAINLATTTNDASSGGRSKVDVIANLDVVEPWHSTSALIIDDVFENTSTDEQRRGKFLDTIESIYNADGVTGANVRNNAGNFFQSVSTNGVLTVFSTGGAIQSDGTYSDAPKIATIENAAPIVYPNLNHLFMSVVAVGTRTDGATSIAANSDNLPMANTKYQLSQWAVPTGDENNPYTFYKSRVCGMAGRGYGGIDPWCFAAVGVNDEGATAAAAGAAGSLRSAFYYMTPQQIFTLMALTADGPYLNRLTSGGALTEQTLIAHLQSLYEMPGSYQTKIDSGQLTYLQAFAEVYGYGVINLERATTPGTNLYFYSGDSIVSTSGNAYWRAASNTRFMGSGALNLGRGAIDVAAFDILESVDGSMRLPRIWESGFAFDEPSRHGLYMGDVLGDLNTRRPNKELNKIGNFGFGLTFGNRFYDDGMGGIDSLRAEYDYGNWKLSADYQRYLTDGESRFDGRANPIWALASNATTAGAEYKYGNWSFGGRAFSGAITDEGLLQNDPAISVVREPGRLGFISGAQTGIGWCNKDFGLNTAFGVAHEDNTVLGAYATGLFDLGDADTTYVDVDAFWRPFDSVRIGARATFAETTPNSTDGAIMQLSELKSNAFSAGLDVWNLNFGVSMPLAVTRGDAAYAYANYDVVEDDVGRYDLVVRDAGMRHIDVAPAHREVRFNATYRHNFGPFTDGAVGFIYRVNPNNIRDFGNESIFMMKLSHSIGI